MSQLCRQCQSGRYSFNFCFVTIQEQTKLFTVFIMGKCWSMVLASILTGFVDDIKHLSGKESRPCLDLMGRQRLFLINMPLQAQLAVCA